ncbi:hypothetical protein GQ457_13G013950 [Hibiscus cannabinus]
MLQGVPNTVSRHLVSVLECQYRYSSPKGGLGTDTSPLVPIPSGNTRGYRYPSYQVSIPDVHKGYRYPP